MIQLVEETGSTNADLLSRIGAGDRVAEGEWLVTRRQTAGRGRQGREWFDGSGNFMGSTTVEIRELDPPTHTLALVTGLAVYEAVVPFCPKPQHLMLKWPNDLLFKGAKLSGVLLEAQGKKVVVGIGVNLAASPKLRDRRTISLADVTMPPDLETFADRVVQSFATELERWRTFGLDPILHRWSAAGPKPDTPLQVHEPDGGLLKGRFVGLDEHGNLRLRLEDGAVHAIHAGDVMLASGE